MDILLNSLLLRLRYTVLEDEQDGLGKITYVIHCKD